MRYACKLRGLEYKQFSLPEIDKDVKLPAVLNGDEVKALLSACKLLKHRLIIGLCYGCGLRCSEVRNLRVTDTDIQRGMLQVRQGKGSETAASPWAKCFAAALPNILLQPIRVIFYLKAMTVKPCRNGEPSGWCTRL